MRFCRYETGAGPRWGRMDGGIIWELDGAPWLGGRETGATAALDGARLLAPAEPSKLVCVGRNYADHAAELGNQVPEEPMLFLKAPSTLLAPGDPILLPTLDQRIDLECELVAVIGRTCRHVPRETALEYVFGYTVGNDVSNRFLQKKDGQFGRAKSFDTFGPLGPWIETDLDPADVLVEARQNGQLRQSCSTGKLIFTVPHLVEFISGIMTLLPGDLIWTGTPAGVAPLAPGDDLELTIAGIGTLRNPVTRA